MIRHLAGIVFVFVCVSVAWMILGGTVMGRTQRQDRTLRQAVAGLWGQRQIQQAPELFRLETVEEPEMVQVDGREETRTRTFTRSVQVPLAGSTIRTEILLSHRKKGLLWYATYQVLFDGVFQVRNDDTLTREFRLDYRFPNTNGLYDGFSILVNDKPINYPAPENGRIGVPLTLTPGGRAAVRIRYRSQGLDQWAYTPGDSVREVNDFHLTLTTNFRDINFPDTAMSPTSRKETDSGWELHWDYDNLVSGIRVGLAMPQKVNPGPFVSRVTFFAPVSLFLFFFVVFIVSVLKKIPLHPMHYFFLGAAFFAFHLLLAYLVDHVPVSISFVVSSAVSLFLTISYMRAVVGPSFAYREIGIAQTVYLVLFSAAFFLEGFTGLAITVCCILTLFVAMQATARVNWRETRL